MWHHLPFLIPLAQESNLIVPQTNPKPHKSYHPSLHAEFQVQVDLLLQRCLLWDELGRAQGKLLKGEGEEGDKEEKEGENCHRSWLTSDGVWKAFMTMCLWLSVTLILNNICHNLCFVHIRYQHIKNFWPAPMTPGCDICFPSQRHDFCPVKGSLHQRYLTTKKINFGSVQQMQSFKRCSYLMMQ